MNVTTTNNANTAPTSTTSLQKTPRTSSRQRLPDPKAAEWRRATTVVDTTGRYYTRSRVDGQWYDNGWNPQGRDAETYADLRTLGMLRGTLKVWYTRKDMMRMYPHIVAHLICESLGYFTPEGAAYALACHVNNEPHFCEYFSHCAGARTFQTPDRMMLCGDGQMRYSDEGYRAALREVCSEKIKWAFKTRHSHKGYMADYGRALALVNHVRDGGRGPDLASWF